MGRDSRLLTLAVFLVSYDSQCSVTLPHCAEHLQCVVVKFSDHAHLRFIQSGFTLFAKIRTLLRGRNTS